MLEWAAEYRWAGRQTDKVSEEQGGEGGLSREEGTRAQTAQPLTYVPCPVGVREKHIQCVFRWENGFSFF